MRIKLNLMQLTLNKNPSTYWLHVDLNNIFLIKQLKKKVKYVLKESRDIDLCLDNVPFLDEDDIHAINENEEITVVVKEINYCSESKSFKTDTLQFDTSNISSNSILSTENIKLNHENDHENDHESSVSSVVQTTSKKRVRKRTHKKKKQIHEPVELLENNFVDIPETSVTSFKEPHKMHKRFKLENGQNNEDDSSSGSDESLHVQREVFRCNSSSLHFEDKDNTIQPVWKKKTPLKTKVTKVPVFVRGQTCTSKNSTGNSSYIENGSIQNSESNTSEDYDMLVVDWKNMNPVKISNISELQIHNLLQFKTLFMNECGEPGMSSVITARLEHIYKNTLHIQVLSGIKEFMMINSKFSIDNEENNGTQREVEFNDLFEVFKLI